MNRCKGNEIRIVYVGEGNWMKVYIGSIIVIILIGFGVWLMLSPSFKMFGESAHKLKRSIREDEEDGEDGTNQKGS